MKMRVQSYDTLESGMIVKIKGQRGLFKVQHIDTWPEVERPPEVTVIGGTGHHRLIRTFLIERVMPAAKRFQRREQ